MFGNMTKLLKESGTLTESESGGRRAILISQGLGSSGFFGPEFFNEENAKALANSLSFPGHPDWSPEYRDPLSAIAWIDEKVDIETNESGEKRFVSTYHVAESKPEVNAYLKEFGKKLGLSIYIEGEGEFDESTGVFRVKTLNADDPYKSVDLVVAAGRGGALLEGARRGLKALENSSAPAEDGKKEENMPKSIDDVFGAVEELDRKLSDFVSAEKAKADASAKVDDDKTTAEEALAARFDQFAADSTLITEAGLTETQKAEAMALAKAGGDVKGFIEKAKKVLDEAKALAGPYGRVAEQRAGATPTDDFEVGLSNFGKVRVR